MVKTPGEEERLTRSDFLRRVLGHSLLGVAAGIALASAWLAYTVTHPRKFKPEDFAENKDPARRALREAFTQFVREEVTIPSPFGYPLHGLYLPMEGAQVTVILCHGIGCDLTFAARYLTLFRPRGWNVLLVDHRHHGQSGGRNTTFGYYEKYDLLAWADWARVRLPPEGKIGVHGESLGAAVALQYAALDPRLAFCIADCSYADLPALFVLRLRRDYNLPAFPFYFVASLESRLALGMWFRQASPLRSIGRVQAPVLFIHGQEDDFIPPVHSVQLFSAAQGIKRLYLAPGAGHAQSFWKDEAAYRAHVEAFLQECGLSAAKG